MLVLQLFGFDVSDPRRSGRILQSNIHDRVSIYLTSHCNFLSLPETNIFQHPNNNNSNNVCPAFILSAFHLTYCSRGRFCLQAENKSSLVLIRLMTGHATSEISLGLPLLRGRHRFHQKLKKYELRSEKKKTITETKSTRICYQRPVWLWCALRHAHPKLYWFSGWRHRGKEVPASRNRASLSIHTAHWLFLA